MRPDQRVVTRIPLSELWDDDGDVAAERGPRVGVDEIAQLLRAGPVHFVVAAEGPLRWIPLGECFAFWKDEVRSRVVPADAERWRPEDHPGGWCYVATRWTRDEEAPPPIVLERYH